MSQQTRAHYLAAHYAHLQGLRIAPLGIPFLGAAARGLGWLDGVPGIRGAGGAFWGVGLFLAALVLSFPIAAYYRHTFGTVRPSRPRFGVPALLLVAALYLVAGFVGDRVTWRVSLPALLIGAALARLGLQQHALRGHYLAIGLAWCLFACSGLYVEYAWPTVTIAFNVLVGASLITAGLGDHLVLVHALRRSPSESHASGV